MITFIAPTFLFSIPYDEMQSLLMLTLGGMIGILTIIIIVLTIVQILYHSVLLLVELTYLTGLELMPGGVFPIVMT